jgi:hypothetical protein
VTSAGLSRSTQVIVMMVCWWVVVATPTVLLLAGLFVVEGPVGGDVVASEGIVVVWVLTFCTQGLILFLLAGPVGHVEIWWLFMGSLLPWIVNYGAPYSLAVGLLLLALAAATAALVAFTAHRTIRLDEHGRLVTATVVREVPTRMTTVVNNIYVRRKVELDIPAPDGTTYRGELTTLYEMGTWPTPGDQITLRVDPDNPRRFATTTQGAAV